MALELQFAYICQKKFEELQGQSETERYCDACGLNVINLDPLDEQERFALFERAVIAGHRLCVAATVAPENGRTCPSPPMPLPPMRTAGMPVMPTPEALEHEQERLALPRREEQSNSFSNLLAKIKFW